MSLKKLQQKLNTILEEGIPEPIQYEKTFLDIARFPRYENVISNILAFYFSPTEEHGFNTLFIDSLIDCIRESVQYQSFEFNDSEFSVTTEYVIPSGERIDILIQSIEIPKKAIIIENKIGAELYNPLKKYWKAVKSTSKVGIVLSIKDETESLKNKSPNFINIQYKDFIKSLNKRLGLTLMDANIKHLVLLKDFVKNIKKMIERKNAKDHVKFFLKNSETIKALEGIKKDALQGIYEEIASAGDTLNFIVNTNGWDSRQLVRKNNSYYKFVIWFQFEETKRGNPYYLIAFQLVNKGLNFTKEILEDDIIKRLTKDEKFEVGNSKKKYNDISVVRYTIELEKLINFSNSLVENFEGDWRKLEDRVNQIINPI